MKDFTILDRKQDPIIEYPDIKPENINPPPDLTEEEIKTALGRQWKSTLLNYEILIKKIERNRADNVVSISQTAVELVKHFKGQPNVNRALKKLKGIIINDIKDSYSVKGEFGLFYAINLNNLEIARKLINDNKKKKVKKVNKEREININYNSISNSNKNINVDFRRIRLSDTNEETTDFDILLRLYQLYPQLLDYQQIISNLNNSCPEEDYHIKLTPTIERNENNRVKKIGIRATTSFSNKKSREKAERRGIYVSPYVKCREDILFDELDWGWTEYDVKGSVPRLSHFITTGEWLKPEDDPYELIFKPLVPVWNRDMRDRMKIWFMKLYFGGSVKEIVKDTIWDGNFPNATSAVKEELTEWVEKAKSTVNDFCGETKTTTIFLDESCIYLDVRAELQKRGIYTIQVYDGFYFKAGDQPEDMDQIIETAARNYVEKYVRR